MNICTGRSRFQFIFRSVKILLMQYRFIIVPPVIVIANIRQVSKFFSIQAIVGKRLHDVLLFVATGVNLYVLRCISQSVVIAYIISDLFLLGVPVVVVVEGSCQNPVLIVVEREHSGVVTDALQFCRVAQTILGVGSNNAIVTRCSRNRET